MKEELRDSGLIVAAHELKSPLALIRQMSLFLEENQADLAADKIDKYLRQITLTSERALRLATDLTKAANLDQLELNFEPIDALELCHQVETEMSGLYAMHQKHLTLHRSRGQYIAVADYGLLKAIVLQFCDNALLYADQRHPVELRVTQNRQYVRIGVRDRGPRLNAKTWQSIKHQRLAPQRISARPQSSGLGLCIAQQFAQAMAGKIDVISHRDGVTFCVDLMISKQLSLL